ERISMKRTLHLPSSRSARRGVTLGVGVATLLASAAIGGALATTAHAATGPIDVLLAVGSDRTQRVVSWYTQSSAQQQLVWEEGYNLDGKAHTLTTDPVANTAADATTTPLDPTTGSLLTPAPVKQTGYYNAHVALSGLKPGRSYTYKVG